MGNGNEFGWYRKCQECSNLIKINKNFNCKITGTYCNVNKDDKCRNFKRKWWMIWVPE